MCTAPARAPPPRPAATSFGASPAMLPSPAAAAAKAPPPTGAGSARKPNAFGPNGSPAYAIAPPPLGVATSRSGVAPAPRSPTAGKPWSNVPKAAAAVTCVSVTCAMPALAAASTRYTAPESEAPAASTPGAPTASSGQPSSCAVGGPPAPRQSVAGGVGLQAPMSPTGASDAPKWGSLPRADRPAVAHRHHIRIAGGHVGRAGDRFSRDDIGASRPGQTAPSGHTPDPSASAKSGAPTAKSGSPPPVTSPTATVSSSAYAHEPTPPKRSHAGCADIETSAAPNPAPDDFDSLTTLSVAPVAPSST